MRRKPTCWMAGSTSSWVPATVCTPFISSSEISMQFNTRLKLSVMLLGYTRCYMPTLALTNSLSFRQMDDPGREFPRIRVLGTIGWIVAGLFVGTMGLEATSAPMRLAAAGSIVLGAFCLLLPHT